MAQSKPLLENIKYGINYIKFQYFFLIYRYDAGYKFHFQKCKQILKILVWIQIMMGFVKVPHTK